MIDISDKIEIFYSYSSKDEKYRIMIEKQLKILERQGLISSWHFRKITAGKDWGREINQHINSAHIILLLISADFLSSDYCIDKEMNRAFERYDADECLIIPIILRPCLWDKVPRLEKLEVLPSDKKAVSKWANKDDAYANVAQRISETIDDLKKGNKKDETNEVSNLVKLAKSDKKERILQLLEQGLNINAQGEDGATAVSILACTNFIDALKILISCGADLNIPDNEGISALIHATINKNNEVINLLVNNGANVNAIRNDGKNALIIFAEQGDIESVQFLLDSGSDPSIIDSNGWNAYEYAKAGGFNTIVNTIIDQMTFKAIGELFFDRKDVHLYFDQSEIIGRLTKQGLQEAEIIESLKALEEKGHINYQRNLGYKPENEIILKYYQLYFQKNFNELYCEVAERLLEHFSIKPGEQLNASSFKGDDFRHQLIGLLFEYFKRGNYIEIAIETGFGHSALSLTSSGLRYFEEIRDKYSMIVPEKYSAKSSSLSIIEKEILSWIYNKYRENNKWPETGTLEGKFLDYSKELDKLQDEKYWRDAWNCARLTLKSLALFDDTKEEINLVQKTLDCIDKLLREKGTRARISSNDMKACLSVNIDELEKGLSWMYFYGIIDNQRGEGKYTPNGKIDDFIINRKEFNEGRTTEMIIANLDK